jgi:hypothetical protein
MKVKFVKPVENPSLISVDYNDEKRRFEVRTMFDLRRYGTAPKFIGTLPIVFANDLNTQLVAKTLCHQLDIRCVSVDMPATAEPFLGSNDRGYMLELSAKAADGVQAVVDKGELIFAASFFEASLVDLDVEESDDCEPESAGEEINLGTNLSIEPAAEIEVKETGKEAPQKSTSETGKAVKGQKKGK